MAKPAEPMPERPRGKGGGQETGKEGDEHSWGLNKRGLEIEDKLDEQPDFVYSTFKLLPRYPSRSIEVCVLAALPPLSHLQAPRRVDSVAELGTSFDGGLYGLAG